jgi:hypothetical protein
LDQIRRRSATEAESKPSFLGLESRPTKRAGAGVNRGWDIVELGAVIALGIGWCAIAVGFAVPSYLMPRKLHVVVVGVSEYQGANPDLPLATVDARDMATAWEALRGVQVSKQLDFDEVNVTVRLDESATADELEAALAGVAERASTRDLFVFYFAGHATQQHLMFTDVERCDGDGSGCWPMERLAAYVDRIPARSQVFLFDTGEDPTTAFSARVASADGLDRDLVVAGMRGGAARVHYPRTGRVGGLFTSSLLDAMSGMPGSHREEYLSVWRVLSFASSAGRSGGGQVVAYVEGGDIQLPIEPELAEATRGGGAAPPRIVVHKPVPLARGSVPLVGPTFEVVVDVFDADGVSSVTIDGTKAVRQDGGDLWRTRLSADPARLDDASQYTLSIQAVDRTGVEGRLEVKVASQGEDGRAVGRQGRDYALLIGLDHYDHWTDLANPLGDVEEIAAVLREQYGFDPDDVWVVADPTRRELNARLGDLKRRGFGSEDQLLVFIAGHGHYDEEWGRSFLVVNDSPSAEDAARHDDYSGFVEQSVLVQKIVQLGAEHVLITLDTCFGGAYFPDKQGSGNRGGSRTYKKKNVDQVVRDGLQHPSQMWMTSGGKEFVPDGFKGKHPPFAYRLLEVLGETRPGQLLTAGQIFEDMRVVDPQPLSGHLDGHHPRGGFFLVASE